MNQSISVNLPTTTHTKHEMAETNREIYIGNGNNPHFKAWEAKSEEKDEDLEPVSQSEDKRAGKVNKDENAEEEEEADPDTINV